MWHLDEAAGDFADSTTHANTGTDLVSATGKSGKVGRGQQFDGTDDRIDLPFILDPSSDTWTIAAWFQFSTLPSDKVAHEVIVSQTDGTGTGRTLLYGDRGEYTSADEISTYIGGSGNGSTVTAAADAWYYGVLVKTGATSFSFYVDGEWQADFTATAESATGGWKLGTSKGNGDPLDGYLDEVRVSSTDRSADWIATEYAQPECPGRLLPGGLRRSGRTANALRGGLGLPQADHHRQHQGLWISDLEDFPVLINTTDLDWRTTGNGGHVVNPTAATSCSQLVRRHDQAGLRDRKLRRRRPANWWPGSGFRLWTTTTTRVLNIYYGNASTVDQWNPEGVWNPDYAGVWHLAEEQSGTGNADLYQDSTSNDHDGDDEVSATGQTGQVGDGQQFDGTDDVVTVDNSTDFELQSFTASAWIRLPDPLPGTLMHFLHEGDSDAASSVAEGWFLRISDSNRLQGFVAEAEQCPVGCRNRGQCPASRHVVLRGPRRGRRHRYALSGWDRAVGWIVVHRHFLRDRRPADRQRLA